MHPAFIFAAILWGVVRSTRDRLIDDGVDEFEALRVASDEVIIEQVKRVAIPRRLTTVVREIWYLQPRLAKRSKKRAEKLLEHPRFRAAYDFMVLRSQCGDFDPAIAKFWTDVQVQDAGQRAQSFDIGQKPAANKRRRPRRRRKPKGETS